MIEFPDILGMELHDATALLEAEGLAFIIVETKPSRKELPEGVLRVIKMQPAHTNHNSLEQNQRVLLTVCKI